MLEGIIISFSIKINRIFIINNQVQVKLNSYDKFKNCTEIIKTINRILLIFLLVII